MASDTRIKQRHAIGLDGLVKTANRIAKRLPGVEAPQIPTRHRYPEMLPLVQMEALAGFLDALDQRLKDEGYAATGQADDDTAPDAPETPPRDETADATQRIVPVENVRADAVDWHEADAPKQQAQKAVVETVKTKAKRG